MTVDNRAGHVPTEQEPYMNGRQLGYFKLQLEKRRSQLIEDGRCFIQILKETDVRRPDLIDQSAASVEMNMEVKVRDRRQGRLRDIDNELARIKEGEYSYCVVTEEEIGVKRLLASPVATMCLEMQEVYERSAYGGKMYLSSAGELPG